MEMMHLQVLERKKWIVDQAKHQTRLFDQHLASSLLIEGIDPPEWLIRSQPSAAEFKREKLITGILQRPLQYAIPDYSRRFSVDEEALDQENNEKYPVDLDNDTESRIDTCNGCNTLSVLPDGTTKGSLNAESGPRGDVTVFSPGTQHKGETSGSHHDLELSLARLQRSRIRQRALEIRSGAKATRSPSHNIKTENSEGKRIATLGIACLTKFSRPHKKCRTDAQPVNVPGSCLANKRGKNSEGNEIATSGIVCQTHMQCVKFSTSSKCSADGQLSHTEETGEVPVISFEGNLICETSGQQEIYVSGPKIHKSSGDSGEFMPQPRSLASNLHAQVQEAIEGNVGDSCNDEVRSINFSKNDLRCLRSNSVGDVDDFIKFEGSSSGKKGKNGHELMHQSTPLDHWLEADEICIMDRGGNDVCQNTQHESACKISTESRRMSYVSDNDKIIQMDGSTKIRELLVEGSSGHLSNESKPLVCLGCQSVESGCVPSSQLQHDSKSASNLQNRCGCDTDQEGNVDDSTGGFLPSRNLAEVNCSKRVLRSQSSTPAADDVIKFEGSSNGKKGKTGHELMHQSTLLDHLPEADEVYRSRNEVCQNGQHESASERLTESRRISSVSDSEMTLEMDCSTEIGELLVEGSSGHASKESKPLVYWGCWSVKSGGVPSSHLQNRHGCDTDQEGYVDDSAGGFLPSRNLAEVVSLVKSKRGTDDFTNDMEVLVPGSISHVKINLESKQLKFNALGGIAIDLDVDSANISPEAIRRSCLCMQASLRQWDDKNEGKPCKVSFEDHTSETTQPDTLPRQTVESSDPTDLVEQLSVPYSNDGASSYPSIGLSSNRFEEAKATNSEEQEETGEQRQPNSLCSEDRHEADAEPVLQENPVLAHHIFSISSGNFSNSVTEDQNDIILEEFVMEKDDDHSCPSEDKCSFKTQAGGHATEQNKIILELLSKSTCLNTPLQEHFMGNTDKQLSRLYQSVPNGLIEHVDLRSSLAMNDGKQGDDAFEGRSYSDCLPYCEAASTRYNGKPYSSPVGKLWESIHSNSGSSKQKHSLITELPSIIEEIELADETINGLNEGISVEMVNARREPLAEIIDDPNVPISDHDEEMARLSLDSTMTGAALPTANRKLRETHKYQESKKRDLTRKDKGSKTFEKGPNGAKRAIKSPKKKLPGPNTSLKNGVGVPSISGRESKLHNIVSNISSFLPLIQQKQAVAPAAGKRSVKVKALEAAEAAKRRAEKKEIDRKMKKEALKLERERVEKENMNRLELEKKRKGEERKKKQADMALKKRLREDKEKREKEKKRKRVEEPCRNQASRHEISCAGEEQPEAKDLDTDAVMTEKLRVDSGEQFMANGDRVGNLDVLSEITASPVGRETLSSMGHEEEIGNPEPSYDISPYKCSDDEDEEEEDDMPNDKFMPSWARKRSIAQDIFRQHRLDPNVIFPPDSFGVISEVVYPLTHQPK